MSKLKKLGQIAKASVPDFGSKRKKLLSAMKKPTSKKKTSI